MSRGQLLEANTGLKRFMAILEAIHRDHPNDFGKVSRITGKSRVYFAQTAGAIERSSHSTNPKKIGHTGWYVTTNTSTRLKKVIIDRVMLEFRYPSSQRRATVRQVDPALDDPFRDADVDWDDADKRTNSLDPQPQIRPGIDDGEIRI